MKKKIIFGILICTFVCGWSVSAKVCHYDNKAPIAALTDPPTVSIDLKIEPSLQGKYQVSIDGSVGFAYNPLTGKTDLPKGIASYISQGGTINKKIYNQSEYENLEISDCPESLFIEKNDSNLKFYFGTTNEISGVKNSSKAKEVYTINYTTINIDDAIKKAQTYTNNINQKYANYKEKECFPLHSSTDNNAAEVVKKYENYLTAKGYSKDEINSLTEECNKLRKDLELDIEISESYIDEVERNGLRTDGTAISELSNAVNNVKKQETERLERISSGSITASEIADPCEVIPEDIRNWIYWMLGLVKYIALVLVVILSVLDFIKAAAEGKDDSNKKAFGKLIKRVIVVVILFLLPVLIELVLKILSIPGVVNNNPLCK